MVTEAVSKRVLERRLVQSLIEPLSLEEMVVDADPQLVEQEVERRAEIQDRALPKLPKDWMLDPKRRAKAERLLRQFEAAALAREQTALEMAERQRVQEEVTAAAEVTAQQWTEVLRSRGLPNVQIHMSVNQWHNGRPVPSFSLHFDYPNQPRVNRGELDPDDFGVLPLIKLLESIPPTH